MYELIKILEKDHPYDVLKAMHDDGSLSLILPELSELDVKEKGHKNNFYHTLKVLKNVCDAGLPLKIKIVAIFHDIGKLRTRKQTDTGKWTFHNHELIGAEMSKEILTKHNTDPVLIDYVYRMVYFHGRTKIHRDVTESAIRRLTTDVGLDIIFDLIEFCKHDMSTQFEDKKTRIITNLNTIRDRIKEVYAKDEEAKWRSPLTGHIIMELLNIEAGKLVGDIKKNYDQLLKSGKITLEEAKIDILKKYKK